jgi:CheY-like chemotaxis protein
MPEEKLIKIMVVDDDKFLLDMYSRKLQKNGFEVVVSVGSEEALNKLKDGYRPEILVFDLIMPKIDGINLYKTINEEGLSPDSVDIVLTNQGQPEDLEKVKDLGIDGYIVKALYTPTEVMEKIKEIYKNVKN